MAQGQTVGQVCRSLGIAEQTFYRWRREYGGLRIEQVKNLKAVVEENFCPLGLQLAALIRNLSGGQKLSISRQYLHFSAKTFTESFC